eukprot:4225891-Karenia_brevis.AAC.1
MHNGVYKAHDPRVPPYAFGYCDGCEWASALLFTCHSICPYGSSLVDYVGVYPTPSMPYVAAG